MEQRNHCEGATVVYVKNLDGISDEEILRKEFAQFGTITHAKLMCGKSGPTRFGFVGFSSPEAATNAVTKMNGLIMGGKPLCVGFVQKQEKRKADLTQSTANNRTKDPMGELHHLGSDVFAHTVPQVPVRSDEMDSCRVPLLNQQGKSDTLPKPGPITIQQQSPPTIQGGSLDSQIYVDNRKSPSNQEYTPLPQLKNVPLSYKSIRVQDPEPLTICMLAAATPADQKEMLVERLFPLIRYKQADIADIIIDMLMELDNFELLHMLVHHRSLHKKVEEAVAAFKGRQSK